MKSKFQAKDFKDLKYNVVGLTHKTNVLTKYPELKKYPEFNENKMGYRNLTMSIDNVFRYCLLMYTDNVIHRMIPEFMHRKREAALLAGFKLNDDGKFRKNIEDLLLCKYDIVNKLTVRIISFNKSPEFRLLVTYEDAFEIQQSKLRDYKNQKANEARVILQNLNELKDNIKDLQRSLLNEDEDKNLLDALYTEIEGIRLGITPEENAQLLKDGNFNKFHKDPNK